MRKITILSAIAFITLLSSCGPKYVFELDQHIGLCGGIGKDSLIHANGLAYAEASVASFLMPEKSEEEFAANREYAKNCLAPVYSANGFYPSDLLVVGPNAEIDRAIKYANTAIRRASELGLKILVLGSSRSRSIPEGWTREQAEEQFLQILKGMAPAAEKYDIKVAIEPLQKSETNFMNTVREGAAMARRAESPNICVMADIFHMSRVGEGPDALIDCADKLVHCHIAENAERTAPGIKGDDFTPYFNALKQIKYKGCISMECSWGEGIGVQMPRTMEFLKKQIASVRDSK